MSVPTDIDTMLETLSSNSMKLSCMSENDMIALCKELIINYQSRSDEWSTAGDWILEELKVLKLLPTEHKQEEEVTDETARFMASATRANIGLILGPFLKSVVK
eukprot:11977271-Ditylum_brightwellii.AAC.1